MFRSFTLLLLFGWCACSDLSSVYCKPSTGDAPFTCHIEQQATVVGASSWGRLYDEINQTGWSRLYVSSNATISDDEQAFAAGYLEGAVSHVRTAQAWRNFKAYSASVSQTPSEAVKTWVEENNRWVRAQAEARSNNYWEMARLVLLQLDGLLEGHNENAADEDKMSAMDLMLWQLQSDLSDIALIVDPSVRPDYDHMDFAAIRRRLQKREHCSALIKVAEDLSDIYASHNTWTSYSTMVRVFRNIDMPLRAAKAHKIQMSGYPGFLASGDDFYQTSEKLVVMETTNEVFNSSLFHNIGPEGVVPYWLRVMVSNFIASSGEEWTTSFAQYNSGTYNNQWQVVDYKKLVPKESLLPGALWILEQIPTMMVAKDMTSTLQMGMWPSFNRPFYPEVYEAAGTASMHEKHGIYFSYSNNYRMRIFRREQGSVHSIDDMKRLMRYNQWQTDPIADGDAELQIAARYDLVKSVPEWMEVASAGGCSDAKITSSSGVESMTVHTISGPTADDQPVFTWGDQGGRWERVPHEGQPAVWDFPWIVVSGSDST